MSAPKEVWIELRGLGERNDWGNLRVTTVAEPISDRFVRYVRADTVPSPGAPTERERRFAEALAHCGRNGSPAYAERGGKWTLEVEAVVKEAIALVLASPATESEPRAWVEIRLDDPCVPESWVWEIRARATGRRDHWVIAHSYGANYRTYYDTREAAERGARPIASALGLQVREGA